MESDREEDSSAVHNVESQNDTKDIEADLKSEAIGSTLYHKTFVFDTLTKMSQSKSKEKFRDIVRCGHKCCFILLIFLTLLRCNAASVRMKPSKLGQFLHSYVTSRLILFLEGAALFTDPEFDPKTKESRQRNRIARRTLWTCRVHRRHLPRRYPVVKASIQ